MNSARWLLGTAVLAVAGGMPIVAQQRFTARTEAVRVDVLVADGARLIHGLTAADFEVRDNGVVQSVDQVQTEHLPLNVIVALDTSSSVAGDRLEHLVQAVRALVHGLAEGDRVALLSFSGRARLVVPLTGDREAVQGALRSLNAEGTTALRDAVFAGLALRESDPGRTLFLFFSDGEDSGSWLSATKVIEAAKRTDVVIYPVNIRRTVELTSIGAGPRPTITPIPKPPSGFELENMIRSHTVTLRSGGQFSDALANATGGRVMMADSDSDLRETFVATLAEFRDRYVVSYRPNGVATGGWHSIDVKLKDKHGKVTARRGYFAQ
jgi:VWFA-related protein